MEIEDAYVDLEQAAIGSENFESILSLNIRLFG
jgi:hypothetical protein